VGPLADKSTHIHRSHEVHLVDPWTPKKFTVRGTQTPYTFCIGGVKDGKFC